MSTFVQTHEVMLTQQRATSAVPDYDAYARATTVIVQFAVILVGFDLAVRFGASATVPFAVVLLPFWLPILREYPLARLILSLAALSAVAGFVLSDLSTVDHVIDRAIRMEELGLLASGMAGFCLLLWARSALPLPRVVALYGAGAVAGALVAGELSWKYDLAVPTTFLVLGLLERHRSRLIPAIAALTLGVIGVIYEGRSFFAACVLAATLTIWQIRPASGTKMSRWFPVSLMAGVGIAVYLLLSSLLTGGAFGEELQVRSIEQIEASGSLIAGGRPEWSATRELVQLNPSGYGVGIVPNWLDRMAGKAGLDSINVDAGGYADHYMFDGQFRLHSVAADLWVRYGWVGVAFAAAIAVALIRSLSFAIAERRAPTSVILASCLAFWYLLFGPIFSNWLDVCVALGLVLATTSEPTAETSGDDDLQTSMPPVAAP